MVFCIICMQTIFKCMQSLTHAPRLMLGKLYSDSPIVLRIFKIGCLFNNKLKLNQDKTEFIIFASPAHHRKLQHVALHLDGRTRNQRPRRVPW